MKTQGGSGWSDYVVGPDLFCFDQSSGSFFLRLHIQDTQNTNMQIRPIETFPAELPCFSTRLSFQMSEEACLFQINCCIKLRLNSPVFFYFFIYALEQGSSYVERMFSEANHSFTHLMFDSVCFEHFSFYILILYRSFIPSLSIPDCRLVSFSVVPAAFGVT